MAQGCLVGVLVFLVVFFVKDFRCLNLLCTFLISFLLLYIGDCDSPVAHAGRAKKNCSTTLFHSGVMPSHKAHLVQLLPCPPSIALLALADVSYTCSDRSVLRKKYDCLVGGSV